MWQAWTNHGILPRPGGWLDQPLSVLIGIRAVSVVYSTFRDKASDKKDWAEFTATQRALIMWLEGEE